MRRFGAPEASKLTVQGNLAAVYELLGRTEEASRMCRDVYTGHVNLLGEDHVNSLMAASNYAMFLKRQAKYDEARSLLRRMIPVARRVFGVSNEVTLKMRWIYAEALYKDANATLDDLREAVNTLEGTERIARRVFGGAHPLTMNIEHDLQECRAALALALAK